MSRKTRALKIILEAEKCIIREGETTLTVVAKEISSRGSRYQITPIQLAAILRGHSRIIKEDKYDKLARNRRSIYSIKETS